MNEKLLILSKMDAFVFLLLLRRLDSNNPKNKKLVFDTLDLLGILVVDGHEYKAET